LRVFAQGAKPAARGRRGALSGGLLTPAAGDSDATMSTRFLQEVTKFARSPQGRRVATEAKRLAKDPETRRRIDEARRRLVARKPA
jgi:hypothetical protein